MSETSLPVVLTWRERAVCHAVDPAILAGELVSEMALYFGPAPPAFRLVWRSTEGPRELDPSIPIGAQIQPEAEVDLEAPLVFP